MDLIARILLRTAMWVRNPPPRRHVVAMGVAVVVAGLIFAVEKAGYWPGWATRERGADTITYRP